MATSEVQIDDGVFIVTKWKIAPNDAIPMHGHDLAYVIVPLVNGTMHVLSSDGSETHVDLRIGEAYARLSGTQHTVSNGGQATIEFVEIEKRN